MTTNIETQQRDPFRAEPVDDNDAHASWTHIGGKDSHWFHRDWTVEEAKTGAMAAAFLASREEDVTGWVGQDMRVQDGEGNTLAALVHPNRLEVTREFAQQVERMKEAPEDGLFHPAVHGPGAGGDAMLIDTDKLRDDLAYYIAMFEADSSGEPRPELNDDDAWEKWRAARTARATEIRKTHSTALVGLSANVAYCLTPYPDERGVVPIRAWHGRPQETSAENEAFWMLAYTTPARGLYVRSGSPNLFGEEFVVVTGSGYAIRGGFISKEVATDYAVAIAAAVPGIDWRTWDTLLSQTPTGLADALMAVNKAWSQFGPNEALVNEPADEKPAAESAPGQPVSGDRVTD